MFAKILVVVLSLVAFGNCDSRIIYRFYKESTYVEDFRSNNFANILTHRNFDRTKQTVIFHYGRGQSLATPHVHDIITAYAVRRNFNFIVIYYEDVRTVSTGNINALAEGISTNLIEIFDRGYNSGSMNLLGFGVGAQIMARASRRTQNRSNRRHIIARLTGLDPFNLGPVTSITTGSLSSADAQWVESIHTDNSLNGDHSNRGHISFFVNGGSGQPGCNQRVPTTRSECDHVFALTIWAESVRAAGLTFPALRCDSWPEFKAGQCNNKARANLGRGSVSTDIRGTFFLATNSNAPWSRNQAQP